MNRYITKRLILWPLTAINCCAMFPQQMASHSWIQHQQCWRKKCYQSSSLSNTLRSRSQWPPLLIHSCNCRGSMVTCINLMMFEYMSIEAFLQVFPFLIRVCIIIVTLYSWVWVNIWKLFKSSVLDNCCCLLWGQLLLRMAQLHSHEWSKWVETYKCVWVTGAILAHTQKKT